MTSATLAPPRSIAATDSAYDTVADLLDRLGGIPPERVRWVPTPGTATAEDAITAEHRFGRLCELVDGTLVEKPVGYYESMVAFVIARLLGEFVVPRRLGAIAGEQGMLRIVPGQVRMPDVSFTS